jgi:GR25 family glycosyltransferase involved in LPS biosynthesis
MVHLTLLLLLCLFHATVARIKDENGDKLKVHVINLNEKKDRWKAMRKLWSPYFTLKRVAAGVDFHARCGLAQTALQLLKGFADDNKEYLLMMEDDAVPTSNFNESFVREAIGQAMNLTSPTWHVLNFAPWFMKQPKVKKINPYLVELNYFHTMHFVLFHKRVVTSGLLKDYEYLINNRPAGSDCIALDDFFGWWGSHKAMLTFMQHSNRRVVSLATSVTMATQNALYESDIAGGPKYDVCAVDAALRAQTNVVTAILGL